MSEEAARSLVFVLWSLVGCFVVCMGGVVALAFRDHKTQRRLGALEARLAGKSEFSTS